MPDPGRPSNTAAPCAQCALPVPPGANFCPQCGTAVAKRHCTRCGAQAGDDDNFCAQCGEVLPRPRAAADAARPLYVVHPVEVRQGTVINCDLVDFTAMTNRLDEQDLITIVTAALEAIGAVVARFKAGAYAFTDSAADRREGDSVMYLFGYPQASEDDAERATQAALAAAAAVGRLQPVPGIRPQVRIGVATGRVVIGPPVRGDASGKPSILGSAPNLAARLRELAPPGGVVAADATWHLVGAHCAGEDLGRLALKGFDEPQRAWLVTAFNRLHHRFAARQSRAGLTPLVGRDAEMTLLLDRWQAATRGRGQVVFLAGEAGVGKSRLPGELVRRPEAEGAAVLVYQCLPHHANTAFHPIVETLLDSMGLDASAPPSLRQERLQALVRRELGLGDAVAEAVGRVLAPTTPAPGEDESPEASMRRRRIEIDSLVELARASLARSRASVIVLEDAQWADPSTIQVMDTLIREIGSWTTLLVVTHRTEFDGARWDGPHVTHMALESLTPSQSAALVARVIAHMPLSLDVVRHIVERTDGVPLFVEEMTKAILESPPLQQTVGRRPGAADAPPVHVPITLRDSLTARLDRSTLGKTVAQAGAVAGRRFTRRLLDAALGDEAIDVERGLADLVEAGLVFERDGPGEMLYEFKHALVQDVALDSLLRDRRREMHERVGRTLEQQMAEGSDVPPELVAHHFTEAGEHGRAVAHWAAAGEFAARRSANLEAIHHLRSGLEALRRCDDEATRQGERLRLLTALSRVLVAAKGYAADEVARTFTAARGVFAHVREAAPKFPVLWTEGQYLLVGARYREALERGLELIQLAADSGDVANGRFGQMLIGSAHLYVGHFALARDHFAASVRVDATTGGGAQPSSMPADVGVPGLAYLARALWFLGLPDEAARRVSEAVALARDVVNPLLSTQAAAMCMLVHQVRGDRAQTRTWIDRTLAEAAEKSQPYWLHLARIVDLWWRSAEGLEDTSAELDRALERYRATGARLGLSAFLLLQSEVLENAGRPADALRAVEEAQAFAAETSEEYYRAELLRRRGTLLLAVGGTDAAAAAEAAFRQGLALAEKQGAHSWSLRCALSLAQWLQSRGRDREAAALLSAAHDRLTEGFDTRDHHAARALLATLSR